MSTPGDTPSSEFDGDLVPSDESDQAAGWTESWAQQIIPAITRPQRSTNRRPRVRKVTRVLRHIDPWSTFKVGLLFSVVAYLVSLTSGILLWQVADATGTLTNVERWFTQFGWETFEIDGSEIFRDAWVIGLMLVIASTGILVLLVTVFNLVSDIIGGIRVTVLEEEVVEHSGASSQPVTLDQAIAIDDAPLVDESWTVEDLPDDIDPASLTSRWGYSSVG